MWALAACLFLGVPAILVVLCALGSRFQSRHVVVPVSPRGALPACNDGLWLALLSPVKRVPLPWLGLSPPQDPSYIPDLSVRATSVATDPAALVELLSVVGVEDTADPHAAAEAGTPTPHTRRPGRLPSTLPLLYFDVITFRLVLLLLAHGRLPWVLLGSVKTAVEVQQWTDVTLEDKHDYSACFVARRPHRRGTELDVRVEVRRTKDAVLVWHSTTSILFFHAVSHTVQKPAPRVPALPASRDPSAHHFVELAGDLGRRYAATCRSVRLRRLGVVAASERACVCVCVCLCVCVCVCVCVRARVSRVRDYNPIHMWNWSAKLFGFRRAMVHGMCLADMVVSRANRLADMTLVRARRGATRVAFVALTMWCWWVGSPPTASARAV